MKIIIPKSGPKPLYYNTHVKYFRGLLDFLKIPYSLEGHITTTKFPVMIDDHKILIDFSDHLDIVEKNEAQYDAYFKYHCSAELEQKSKSLTIWRNGEPRSQVPTIYPFAPISFYDWERYNHLSKRIKYTGTSNIVLNMQRPYAGALERRNFVQKMLKSKYQDEVITRLTNQTDYWEKINTCLVHVFVPGARNDMIDRGHIQYFAFGCCTIAPHIVDVFPYQERIEPGVHYIECAADYSDLIEKIEWCKEHRDSCRRIGENAKRLFERTCTPQKLWDWILSKVILP